MLVRRPGEAWRKPATESYPGEGELQQLIFESPELLPGVDGTLPVAREFPCAFGSVDLVGVTLEGQVILAECKLASNPELRRKVIGQLLAYAAALWSCTWDEFAEAFERRAGRPLVDVAAEIAADTGDDWDEEAFRRATSECLAAGAFHLVVVVEALPEELREIVRFLNTHSQTGVNIVAVELAYRRDGNLEILEPTTWGEETAKTTSPRQRGRWSEAGLLDALAHVNVPYERVEALWALLREWSSELRWGGGADPAVSCWIPVDGVAQPVFGLHASEDGSWPAYLDVRFGYVHEDVTRERIAEVIRGLPGGEAALRGLEEAEYRKRPGIAIDDLLSAEDAVERLRLLLNELK